MTRPPRPRRRSRWSVVALVALVVLMATAGGEIVVEHPFSAERSAAAENAAHRDPAHTATDGDGLSDAVELAGWTSGDGGLTRTDPRRADTDRDGLPDGLEAGEVSNGAHPRVVVAGTSDPDDADTDGDRVRDADEYFLALDARARDTDRDGADDAAEMRCGSDAAASNSDGDSHTDSDECELGSDPLVYDLTLVQGAAAVFEGAVFAKYKGLAAHAGRMNSAQTESWEYLVGEVASAFLPLSVIRGVVRELARGRLKAAVREGGRATSAAAIKTALVAIVKFARRSEHTERSATSLLERLPLSGSTKAKVLGAIFGDSARLPAALDGGPSGFAVYRSGPASAIGFVGITDDFARQAEGEETAGRSFDPELMIDGLTRNQARAVEEACLAGRDETADGRTANRLHSIRTSASYYDQAVRYGLDALHRAGMTCP